MWQTMICPCTWRDTKHGIEDSCLTCTGCSVRKPLPLPVDKDPRRRKQPSTWMRDMQNIHPEVVLSSHRDSHRSPGRPALETAYSAHFS